MKTIIFSLFLAIFVGLDLLSSGRHNATTRGGTT